jgi:two-component system phosphate regulon sensor histidine kinase PhoR
VRIHHPLFAGFLGVVGLLVVLVVAFVGTGLRGQLVDLTRAEVDRQVLIARGIVETTPRGADLDSLADAMSTRIGHRVSFVGSDGYLIGDSELDPSELRAAGSHIGPDRPEILAARAGTMGVHERRSSTLDVGLLYVAEGANWQGEAIVVRIAAPLSGIQATLRRSQGSVAAAGVFAMLIALIVAYWISRGMARPLVALSERAALLAQGDFSQKVPRRSRVAELDELAAAFNRLTDELNARLDELAREKDEMQALIDCMAEGVVALTDDARILRTNRAARALLEFSDPPMFAPVGTIIRQPELRALLEQSVVEPIRAREVALGDRHFIASSRKLDDGGAVTTFLDVTEIRRLEQVRRDFVANASHELKTPLTAMRGYAETLVEDDPPPKIRRDFLKSIRKNTVRLQLLIEDLLDLSRLESGGWIAIPEAVDLAEMAVIEWEELEADTPKKKRRDLEFAIEGQGIAWADPQGVRQILRNLLDNARRYTNDGGSVVVTVGEVQEGRMIRLEVTDTGTGIPTKSLPRIFERFYRADTSRAREVGGTGLGLAIVRHLVEVMNGDVGAESELGRGTTIHILLPAADGREHA